LGRKTKAATCGACLESSASGVTETRREVDRGAAGGSARREFQRRHERREADIRERHKRLSGVILALSSDPQSTTAWAVGARREETVGRNLEALRAEGIGIEVPGAKDRELTLARCIRVGHNPRALT
jgi:hypothetical protein